LLFYYLIYPFLRLLSHASHVTLLLKVVLNWLAGARVDDTDDGNDESAACKYDKRVGLLATLLCHARVGR
jgi:hypothetical protein